MRVVGLSHLPPRPWNRSSGPSWLSQSSCFQHLSAPSSTFVSFAPPSETPTGMRRPSLLAFPHRPPKCPPLSSQPVQTASLGVVQISPLRRLLLCESSPSLVFPKEPAAFGLMLPSIRHLPPLSFLPTPTVYSSLSPAGLLHPAPGHGVRAVSFRASCRSPCGSRPSSRLSSSSPFTPYRAFPSYTAALRLRSRCLLAVVLVPCPFQIPTEVFLLSASST